MLNCRVLISVQKATSGTPKILWAHRSILSGGHQTLSETLCGLNDGLFGVLVFVLVYNTGLTRVPWPVNVPMQHIQLAETCAPETSNMILNNLNRTRLEFTG